MEDNFQYEQRRKMERWHRWRRYHSTPPYHERKDFSIKRLDSYPVDILVARKLLREYLAAKEGRSSKEYQRLQRHLNTCRWVYEEECYRLTMKKEPLLKELERLDLQDVDAVIEFDKKWDVFEDSEEGRSLRTLESLYIQAKLPFKISHKLRNVLHGKLGRVGQIAKKSGRER